jgi:hypothetical protein
MSAVFNGESDAPAMHLSIGPPGAARFDHDDGGTEAIVRPARLSVVTGHPSMSELGAAAEAILTGQESMPDPTSGRPVVIEARGPAGAVYLELLPATAEALGLALIRHASKSIR